ncbi:MAG: transcription termination/antitermination protein NusG, partial [bacterium]
MTDVEQKTPESADAGLKPAGNKRWYVVHAYSGMEKSVAKALQ